MSRIPSDFVFLLFSHRLSFLETGRGVIFETHEQFVCRGERGAALAKVRRVEAERAQAVEEERSSRLSRILPSGSKEGKRDGENGVAVQIFVRAL